MAYLLTLIICTAPMECRLDTAVFQSELECNIVLSIVGESWLTLLPTNQKARVWAACTPHKPT